MTPWHCAIAVDVRGNFKTAHVRDLRNTHDVVYKYGRPYFFRERSPLYQWEAKVEFGHLYGGGLVVYNVDSDGSTEHKSLSDADRAKLASLALLQGSVRMKGFK